MNRQRVRLEFRCPECNSREFGSSLGADLQLTRICHGQVYDHARDALRGCRYSWKESDDWQHFVLRFGDLQSFQRAQRELTPTMVAGAVVGPLQPPHEYPATVMPGARGLHVVPRPQTVGESIVEHFGRCGQCGARGGVAHVEGCPLDPMPRPATRQPHVLLRCGACGHSWNPVDPAAALRGSPQTCPHCGQNSKRGVQS